MAKYSIAWNETVELSELVGSPKQIAWAEDIRSRDIGNADLAGYCRLAVEIACKVTSAAYWIENRHSDWLLKASKRKAEALEMTKSDIFKLAWRLARKGAEEFGGSSKQYFAESLKEVYATIKRAKMV